MAERFVSTKEAAELMGRSVNLVGKLARQGRLPGARKAGRTIWIIPLSSVSNYRPGKKGAPRRPMK